MTSPMSFLAACAVVLVWLTVRELRSWWSGARVERRLGGWNVPPAPRWVRHHFTEAGIDGDVRTHLRLWGLTIALAIAAVAVVDGGPIVLAIVVVAPPAALFAARGRGDRLRSAQFPVALDTVAGSLRGGTTLPVALGDAASVGGRLGAELETMTRHVRDGRPLPDALEGWAQDDDPATALAGASLTLAASVGGPGADAIEAAAASLRERAAIDGEVAALSVQARLSAGILSVAPLGFAVLLVSLDPTSAHFLLATPAGWACITVGFVLDAAGAAWMHHLVRSAS
ncbi:MAG: type II secretion system F family protein [Acidimicrobiales bacterium]|nr:type II secretion system F family protein [Acidimicrobiales bacterium]